MVNKLEKSILTVLEYIVAIFLVLECRSVYLFSVDSEFYIMQILGISMFALFAVNVFFEKIKITDILKDYKFIIGLTVYNLIFAVVHRMHIAELVRYFYIFEALFLFLYVYYKSNSENIKNFFKKIVNVIVVIALISLFFYIFGTIFNIIPITNTFLTSWGDFGEESYVIHSYYNLHFNVQEMNILGMKIFRNTGMFAEAPMYALNLLMALIIQKFILKERNWFKIIVLVITIFTTLSTMGILGCIIFGAICLISNKKFIEIIKKKVNKKILITIFTIVTICIITVATALVVKKMQTASFGTRVDDYIASVLAWKDRVLFGNGMLNEEAIINYMSKDRIVNTGVSNSVATILANGGIYLSLIYIYSFCALFKSYRKTKDMDLLYLLIMMLFLAVTTVFQYTIMMINIMVFGIVTYKNCNNKNTN